MKTFLAVLLCLCSLVHAASGETLWGDLDPGGQQKLLQAYRDFFAGAMRLELASNWRVPPAALQSVGGANANLRSLLSPSTTVNRDEQLQLVLRLGDKICETPDSASAKLCATLASQIAALTPPTSEDSDTTLELTALIQSFGGARGEVAAAGVPPQGNCVERRDAPSLPKLGRTLFTDLQRDLPVAPLVAGAPEAPSPAPSAESGNVRDFEREVPRPVSLCGGSQGTNFGYGIQNSFPCDGSGSRVISGVGFQTDRNWPYYQAGVRVSASMHRAWRFLSKDGARSQTYIELEDNILASCPSPDPNHDYQDSCNVKSTMVLFPRRTMPSAERVGDDIRVTLPTGEVAVFDARTHALRASPGAPLREGPPDFTIDRQRRQPPNVSYSGPGISIVLASRFQDTTTKPGLGPDLRATVTQNGRTCTVARSVVFDDSGNIRNSDDAAMVAILNRACPGRNFNLP